MCCAPNQECVSGQCTTCGCGIQKCGADACGNWCGNCPYPMTCMGGTCVGCVGTCSSGQQCGDDGCGNPCGVCVYPLVCDGYQCVPPPCDPSTCQPGQGCYDPTTMGPGSVCTCLPAQNGASDTCASLGLACDWNWYNPAAATCRKPREYDTCTKAVGCDSGFDCVSYYGKSYCLQPCKKSGDCTSAYDYCEKQVQNHCWYNVCADPSTNPGARSKYFKPCTASAPGDGFCLPTVSQDQSGQPTDIGVCYQTGSALPGGQCSMQAGRTRMSELCPQGQYCFPLMPDPLHVGEQLGQCRPPCNAAPQPDPVATCDATSTCIDMSGSTLAQARLGMCDQTCVLFNASSTGCPPDALGEAQTCFPQVDGTANGYCWSVNPYASAPGGPCQQIGTAGDLRSECQAGSFCSPGDYVCLQLCSTDLCPSPSQTCASCPHLQPTCQQYAAPIGYCSP